MLCSQLRERMALKTYGQIKFEDDRWLINQCQPHVCIKLKAIFTKISKTSIAPFEFKHTPENCTDLKWFMDRYPLEISQKDMDALLDGVLDHRREQEIKEQIFLPSYSPPIIHLKGDAKPRQYQVIASELHKTTKRLLLGDDIGIGKTLSGVLTLTEAEKLPALVVVQTHLTKQWQSEINKFTHLDSHIIKGTKPYSLPFADVYIMKYSCLSGWVDVFTTGYFKSVIFDEIQELRRPSSNKYAAAKVISENVDYALGLSATPIYNFGDEIFYVMDLIKPGCLGKLWDFLREWTTQRGMNHMVIDPKALGTYLRDNYLMLRRTRTDVGRELPLINKIIHTVGYDEEDVKKSESLAHQLAIKITTGSFVERGSAARELDMLVRQTTGVSKAREVAAYVKILLENDEPVVLAGWHREVYSIWKDALQEYNPVFYTGTESDKQKQEAKESFVSGKTNLFIISLRSGIGLDGLQQRCRTVVIGELDWSPKVHEQLIGRVDRDGQTEQVTAIYLVSEYGSDPVIIDLLGLKSSQAHGIVDPLTAPVTNINDDSRIKILAEKFLHKRKSQTPEIPF